MATLAIDLLGIPSITLDKQPLDAQTYKATALLAYLAVTQTPHSRQELATLLWTELDADKALAALRTTLWKLKQAGIGDWLDIHRDAVSLSKKSEIEIDVIRFQELVAQCDTHGHPPSRVCPACLVPLRQAADLYRGDFMKGFSLRDAGDFDNWQSTNIEFFKQNIRQVLEKLVKGHRSVGEFERSIFFIRRLIAYDRYNEDIHRQLMDLYLNSGLRTEAIQHYRELAKSLQREAMQPQLETTQLYNQILSERTEPASNIQELEIPVILATDIENADEMWANYRAQMIRTVSRYNGIVKECAALYGGYLIKQNDDASVLYFDKGQPLQCALAIHKRLMRTTWTVNTIPRIRIALTTASKKQSDLDNYSADFHSTRHLLSAGWGGQVLLTAQVWSSVDHLQNMQVHDLGVHLLKDLQEPLRIFMLVHPSLPSREFPPLQSLSSYRQNLPSYATAFIDRENEQAELAAQLAHENCRLLTLIGPGGVGKTRLALQVAAQQINNFSDGVYFVPVTTPKSADLIPSLLAETFKYNFYEQKDPLSLIIDYLREKKMLLVIDNFEHLTEGALLFTSLLEKAPGLKIMVTSRERLNLHNEWIYEVTGMSFPPENPSEPVEHYGAIQLFLHNAQRMLPEFTPTVQDLAAIARICKMVDGVPLAIELATAWIRTLSCYEIAGEIEQNLDFLSTTMRDIPARHRSLRAVFEHSWALLSEESRRTYRKLAVFRGGFTAQAALQVAKTSSIELAGFVDRSLLRRISYGRYEIIEVLRHFAEQKLHESQEDYVNTRNAHSAYYFKLIDDSFPEMLGPDVSRVVNMMRTDFENIRIAGKWAADHGNWKELEKATNGFRSYLEVTGHYATGFKAYSHTLSKLDLISDPELETLKNNVKLGVGWTQFCCGEHAAGLRVLNEVMDAFTALGSQHLIATTGLYVAKAYERLNQLHTAIELAERNLQILRNDHDTDQRIVRTLISQTLEVYGFALLKLERTAEAKKVLQEGLRLSQEMGQSFGSVRTMDALSGVLVAEGDLNGALSLRLQALKIAKDFENRYIIGVILNNISHIYMTMNDFDKAMRYQLESIEIGREIGHRWMTAVGLNNLGYIFRCYFSDYTESIRLYNESLLIFTAIEDQRGMIYTWHDMALVMLEAKQSAQARDYLLNALDKAHQTDSPPMELYILSSLASVILHSGDVLGANELCTLIQTHPLSDQATIKRANTLLGQIEDNLAEPQIQESRQRGQTADLEQVVSGFLSQR